MAMSSPKGSMLTVTLCIDRREVLDTRSLAVPSGTTVGQVIAQSSVPLPQAPLLVGIFGQRCELTRVLCEGDRVEVYRPLVVEPKAARRRRAIHREKIRNIKKKMPIDDLTV